jgi:iron-sulfur cluster repair protein YtfE (RIC family)
MNAIKFLLREHNKFRKILGSILDKSHRATTKRKMFDNLSNDLVHHEKVEETVWYPYLKKNTKLASTIRHLTSEEKAAEKEIAKLKKAKDQDEWDQQYAKFKRNVEHHASEEEEALFPKVEQAIDEEDLKKIGKRMQQLKKTLDAPSKIMRKIAKS